MIDFYEYSEHDHHLIIHTKRLRNYVKERIVYYFSIKVTIPSNIIYHLRKEDFKNLPDQKQIRSFLSIHKKNKR